MRYCIVSKGLGLSAIQAEVIRFGGKNIKLAPTINQLFCDLDTDAAAKLANILGLAVKQVSEIKTGDFYLTPPGFYPTPPQQYEALQPVYGSSQVGLAAMLYDLRAAFTPPALGEGSTIAVLDTGIRKTHRSLRDKVVYEVDCSGSGNVDDVYDHGTAVAYIAVGGRHALGEECGVAPGAKVMNIKVLGDDGKGTTETVLLGIDEVAKLITQAKARGLGRDDPLYPDSVNMSFGTKDDGDLDNPIRLAVKSLWELEGGKVYILTAAGNSGPTVGTIELPAACPEAFALGTVGFVPFEAWEQSARGPTPDGVVKPDFVFYGLNLLLASSKTDDAFIVKTGTSFSAPIAAGAGAVFWQGLRAILKEAAIVPTAEEAKAILALVSRKPEGAPAEKDNTYGWGMPMGDLALRILSQVSARAYPGTEILGVLAPVIGMALAMKLVGGIIGQRR